MIAKPARPRLRRRAPARRRAAPPGPRPAAGNGTDSGLTGTAPASSRPAPPARSRTRRARLLTRRASRSTARARTSRCGSRARATARSGSARAASPPPTWPPPATAAPRPSDRPLDVTSQVAKRLTRRRTVAATGIVRQGGHDARLYFELTAGRVTRGGEGLLDRRPPRVRAGLPRRARLHGRVDDPDLHPRLGRLVHAGERLALARQRRRERRPLEHVDGVGLRGPAVPSDGAAVPVPWTLGPIAVPPAAASTRSASTRSSTGRRPPDHQWQYVNAGTTGAVAAGGATRYCVYP